MDVTDPDDYERENYTWEQLAQLLALNTHLTHREAVEIAGHLQRANCIHPYDARIPLARMIIGLSISPGNSGAATFALNLIKFTKESW